MGRRPQPLLGREERRPVGAAAEPAGPQAAGTPAGRDRGLGCPGAREGMAQARAGRGGPGGDGAGAGRRGLRGRRGLAARAALRRGTLQPRTLRAPGPGSYRAAPPRLLAGSGLGPGGELARWRGPNPLSPASGQQPTPRRRSPGPPSLPRGPRPQPAPCPSHTAAEDCAGAEHAPPTSAAAQASTAQPTRLASLPALDRAGAVPSGRP